MHSSLRRQQKYLLQMLRFTDRYPLTVIVLFALLTLALFTGLGRFYQVVSIQDQLDPKMESTQDLLQLKTEFGAESSLGLIFDPRQKLNAEFLCVLQLQINDLVFKEPLIEGFFSPFKIRRARVQEGLLSYPRLISDPCAPTTKVMQELPLLHNSPWAGVVTRLSNFDFGYFLKLGDLPQRGPYGSFSPQVVENIWQVVKTKYQDQVYIVGTAAQQFFTMQGMAQAQYLNIAVVFIILFSMRGLFGTWRAGILFLFTLGLANLWIVGIMAYLGWPMDLLGSCLFIMLAIASLEDFIFLSYFRIENNSSYRTAYRRLIMPCLFTSLTTLMGFVSLVISDVQSIQRFGAMAALGAGLEWLIVFGLLPAIFKKNKWLREWVAPHKIWVPKQSLAWMQWTPSKRMTRVSLLVFALAFLFIFKLNYSQNPSEIFPKDHVFQKSLDYVFATRGWQGEISLLFSPQVDSPTRVQVMNTLKGESGVHKIESYEDVVQFIVPNQLNQGLTRETIEFELAHSPIAKRYISDSKIERVYLYLRSTASVMINDLRLKVQSLCPQKQCWLSGEFVAFADYSQAIIKTLFESLFVSILLVGLVLYYLCWATGRGHFWSVVISSLWGPAGMIILIYLLGVSVNMITCIVASAIVGLTGDNAIQFLFAGRNLQEGIKDRATGSFQCVILMVLCCSVFFASYFEPPRVLGFLLASGLIFSTLGDVFVLKGLTKRK